MNIQPRLAEEAIGASAREFAFDASDFEKISAILYADSGIHLSSQKAPLLYGRLIKRLRALGMSSFKDYCALLEDVDGLDERQKMLSAMTTNVTAFFREKHHFDQLEKDELPKLFQKTGKSGRVRLWSAACSKGHEAYSLAMTILSVAPDAAERDIRVLATDIDPAMVEAAREGVYTTEDLSALAGHEVDKHFKPCDSTRRQFVVNDRLRRLVAVRELNLVSSWPMTGRFQVVFCRNVAIYFDQPTQQKLWSRFASVLTDEGLLCIGHSERLSGAAQDRFTPVGTTAYRLSRQVRP